jgi:hypothetical protein
MILEPFAKDITSIPSWPIRGLRYLVANGKVHKGTFSRGHEIEGLVHVILRRVVMSCRPLNRHLFPSRVGSTALNPSLMARDGIPFLTKEY